jgi:AcrR family transcriptional regulator
VGIAIVVRMATASVEQPSPPTPANARARALARRMAAIDPTRAPGDERLEALAVGLVDALVDADEATLRMALEALRGARARTVAADADMTGERRRLLGWLDAMIAVAYWAVERMVPEAALTAVARGTRAWSFLQALEGSPQIGSATLRELLATDETQVSRTGRRLLESGLVGRRRVGRNVYWELTPRGRRVLELAGARTPGPGAESFWMEAIRRGFEGAAGDEPGDSRRVDPTRERIVESTVELHEAQGIRATTLADIAARAGVEVETVERYFPTQDDLIKGCGQHILMSLRLPPPERAAEIFAGARSEHERVRRLVETLFDVYERRGQSLENARGERAEVPLLDDSMGEVDAAIDALVAEALGGRGAGAPNVAPIRALTDLTMWRALRDEGASPAASAEQASAAVERWLHWHSAKAAAP